MLSTCILLSKDLHMPFYFIIINGRIEKAYYNPETGFQSAQRLYQKLKFKGTILRPIKEFSIFI